MSKISVMYPDDPGARFDHDYHRAHMPLVRTLLGDGCPYDTVDRKLAGRSPASAPIYVALGLIFSTSLEASRQRWRDTDPPSRPTFPSSRTSGP